MTTQIFCVCLANFLKGLGIKSKKQIQARWQATGGDFPAGHRDSDLVSAEELANDPLFNDIERWYKELEASPDRFRIAVVAYHWDGDTYILDSVFIIDPSPPANYLPSLVTWSFSSASVSFKFAVWSFDADVEYSAALGHFGALATAPGTITQTLTLGGAAYTLATVASQAAALRDAISFDAMAWRTSRTNTWDATGAVVSSQNFAATIMDSISESGAVGTPIPWAVAVNGCPFTAGATQYFSTKALVDVCGNYCARTYQEGTSGPTSCTNGNVDGYAPLTLAAPGTPGQSVAVYSGQC